MSHDSSTQSTEIPVPLVLSWHRLAKTTHGLLCYVCPERINQVPEAELFANVTELMCALDNLLASRRK